MPEGPEVEAARALVARNVLNLKIIKATVADDEKVFMGKRPEEVQRALEGRSITAACRKAKYLWFMMDGQGPMPLLHFGMTGSVVVEGVGAAQYKRVTVDTSEWPPRFWKLQLEFEEGARLAFVDSRRFGRVQLLTDPRTQEPVSKLGFDVIDELPDVDAFVLRFAAHQRPGSTLRVKALLLDQAFTAGVGNWVADEVLYQARIHPEQLVADMTEWQMQQIHASLKTIMQIAVAADADSDKFPRDWLFHYRWTGKRASSVGGHAVEFVTVGSRTSAFVPALQKIIAGTGLSLQKAERKPRTTKRKPIAEADEEGVEPTGEGPEAAGSAAIVPRPATKPRDKKPTPPTDSQDGVDNDVEVVVNKEEGNKLTTTAKRLRAKMAVAIPVVAVQEVKVAVEEGSGGEKKTGSKKRSDKQSRGKKPLKPPAVVEEVDVEIQEEAEGKANVKEPAAKRSRGKQPVAVLDKPDGATGDQMGVKSEEGGMGRKKPAKRQRATKVGTSGTVAEAQACVEAKDAVMVKADEDGMGAAEEVVGVEETVEVKSSKKPRARKSAAAK